MDEIQEKIKRLSVGIQEVIECPICFITMDSSLKLCTNGHGVCKVCAEKIDKCPSCEQGLVFHRNTLLAQILDCLPKQCCNTDKGCNTIVFDKEHEVFCGFRTSKCLKSHCSWEGCAKDLLNHLKICAKGSSLCEFSALNVKKLRSYTFGLAENKHFFSPILFQDKLFWKYFHWNALTKGIYHKFYHIPLNKPTSNYYLIISFKKGQLEYTHTCKAITDDVKNDGDYSVTGGLILPDSELKHFLKPGRNNTYQFNAKLVSEDIV